MALIHGFDFPDDLHYLLAHDMWARQDADGLVTVGITPLGCHVSGEFIEFMPKPVGTRVERERSLGLLEMSKVLRSIRSPVDGTIAAHNEAARARPLSINADPYGDGWLVKVRADDWPRDVAALVTGSSIPAAAASYMENLAETFGIAPP